MEETIANQKKYFKWYQKLPLIFAVAILVSFFIWGIIDPCVFHFYHRGYVGGHYTYGVFNFNNGFLCWLVWMIIGVVLAGIEYIVCKIMLSQKILSVLYLEKMSASIDKDASHAQDRTASPQSPYAL